MISAIIGAQYGDEGKGLLVDYTSRPETLVVRFNGGAQAGHTVVTPEGRRHVFGHIGAGTLAGALTLLSDCFIVNPILFLREWALLNDLRPRRVLVDGLAPVTTPWDMMLNVAVEAKRGAGRHGSCGLGINETVVRGEAGFSLEAISLLARREHVVHRLRSIRDQYVRMRAKLLEVELGPEAWDDALVERFVDDCTAFTDHTVNVDGAYHLQRMARIGDVVFEGAQGLRLDACAPDFPHVTRSRTGLTNVLGLLADAGVRGVVHVTYVTRTYVTRHGAGPLADECDGHPFRWHGPETNVDNPHQGSLRYARLNGDHLRAAIRRDLDEAVLRHGRIDPALAVTCLDQTGVTDVDADLLAAEVGLPLRYLSFGPTRADVEFRRAALRFTRST